MKQLPQSDIYEQEFDYMPWGQLIDQILEIVEQEAPQQGKVLDLLCGPGFLLGEIHKKRSDLVLHGVDIDKEYISYAQKKYNSATFEVGDVLKWNTSEHYDVLLCTGGVHHLPYDRQEEFIQKTVELLKPKGFAVFADPYVSNYTNELERKKAAAKLGYEYMVATMKNGATDDIIKATVDILYNDVMGFEYKTSIQKLQPIFEKLFSKVTIHKTWPDTETEYGDYYIICQK